MIGPWDRIEGSPHDDELDAGVEAHLADPLWLLARQWQVGELRADDAARPVAARLEWRAAPVQTYRPLGDGPRLPMPRGRPLERVVEAAPAPRGGAAGLRWSTRLAALVARRLARAGLDDAVAALVGAEGFALRVDDAVALPGHGTTAVELLRRRSFDGAALLDATTAVTNDALSGLGETRRSAAIAVIDGWRDGVRERFGGPQIDAWDETRLEHRFALAAPTDEGEVVLAAREHVGGHLDWYSFDIEPAEAPAPKKDSVPAAPPPVTAIPTPVRYAGMPAARWWAFEEGDVHFGDLAAAPGDLGRLLVADYATVYGNDWFSIPLRVPTGTLAQVRSLRVHDTMGGHLDIAAAATLDRRGRGRRAFRLYELTGDPSVAADRAPLLFVAPSLSGSSVGPALERVELVRDEAANLAWGIERLVEGATGLPVDRLQHWRTAEHQMARAGRSGAAGRAGVGVTLPGPAPAGLEWPGGDELTGVPEIPDIPDRPGQPGGNGGSEVWRYRLETTAPPYWVPFVPVRIGSGVQIRLRRARMQEWELLDRSLTGPKGELLQRHQPMVIEEEEVPRGGATLERRWQVARWTDGSVNAWLQRSKRLGRGERSAGVRWDSLLDRDE